MKKLLFLFVVTVITATLGTTAYAADTDDIFDIHNLVNQARAEQGLTPLARNEELDRAAMQRAKEISVKYTSDHTRPDGSDFFTVSTLVWGENIAYGYPSGDSVMAAWMRSAGHKRNILKPDYTTMGAAFVESGGVLYWVQVFGTGRSNSSWSGIPPSAKKNAYIQATDDSTHALEETTASNSDVTHTPEETTTYSAYDVTPIIMAENGAINALTLTTTLYNTCTSDPDDEISVRVINAKAIAADTIELLHDTAQNADKTVFINADTTTSDGKSVQGRLDFNPSDFSGRDVTLNLEVRTDSPSTQDIKAFLDKFFECNLHVVDISHQGPFGATVTISAKLDWSGFNMDTLYFYSYDVEENRCTLLEDTRYFMDVNGFLHFDTPIGGNIVITDQQLD